MTENTKVCPKCMKTYERYSARLGSYCNDCNRAYNSVLHKLKSEHKVPEDHRCLICQKSESELKDIYSKNGASQSKWALDHCHESGQFRGFLCRNCNNGLGRFQDNPDLLIKAANYLNLSSGKFKTGS